MLTAALFTIARLFRTTEMRKKPKCPWMEERISKIRSLHTMNCCSLFKEEGNPVTGSNRDEP